MNITQRNYIKKKIEDLRWRISTALADEAGRLVRLLTWDVMRPELAKRMGSIHRTLEEYAGKTDAELMAIFEKASNRDMRANNASGKPCISSMFPCDELSCAIARDLYFSIEDKDYEEKAHAIWNKSREIEANAAVELDKLKDRVMLDKDASQYLEILDNFQDKLINAFRKEAGSILGLTCGCGSAACGKAHKRDPRKHASKRSSGK